MSRSSGNRRYLAIAGAALVASAAFVAGEQLNGGQDTTPHISANSIATTETVTTAVTRGDITEIVTLPAMITALPLLNVIAPHGGQVTLTSLTSGQHVSAGQTLFRINQTVVAAPVAGTFNGWLVTPAATTAAGIPVARMTYDGFAETAILPPGSGYRILSGSLKARAEITDGPGPFDCPIVQVAGSSNESAVDQPVIACAIPMDTRAYSGLAGTIAVASGQAENVLLLPCQAVAGSVQQGEVSLVGKDGRIQVVQVGLGLSDGSMVQITSGLAEGDRVLPIAPSLAVQ